MTAASLDGCMRLQTLVLNNNMISRIERNFSLSLPSVLDLNLAHNEIRDLSLFAPLFAGLSNLKVLDLSFNAIQGLDGRVFGEASIQKLILAGNGLKVMHGECMGLKSLTHADFSHNVLTDIPSSILCRLSSAESGVSSSSPCQVHGSGCKKLSTLILSNNSITSISSQSFTHLGANLKELDISHNRLLPFDGRVLSPLVHLRSLDMRNCSLDQFPDLHLPKLVHLNLEKNLISSPTSSPLSKSRNIKNLDLSHNQLTDISRSLFRFVSGLIELDVSHNPVEVLDSASLNDLLQLRHLDMSELSLKYMDSRLLHSLR